MTDLLPCYTGLGERWVHNALVDAHADGLRDQRANNLLNTRAQWVWLVSSEIIYIAS
jgi:hypothetical protein